MSSLGGGGSGLGLWISEKIVELHGGIVGVSSAGEGYGCTFYLEIPMEVRECLMSEVTPPPLEALSALTRGSACSSFRNVLMVDDSALNRKMMNRLLTRKGYICYEAEDGTDAVDLVRKSLSASSNITYDLILMDNVMPIMIGPLATQAIRSMGYTGPVIGITGNALREDIAEFKAYGADDVLPKPLDMNAFDKIVARFQKR